jgi:Fe-S-cluster-containing hydrogenase component 2
VFDRVTTGPVGTCHCVECEMCFQFCPFGCPSVELPHSSYRLLDLAGIAPARKSSRQPFRYKQSLRANAGVAPATLLLGRGPGWDKGQGEPDDDGW